MPFVASRLSGPSRLYQRQTFLISMGFVLDLRRSNCGGVTYNELSSETHRHVMRYLALDPSERSNGVASCSRLCNIHWRWHQRRKGERLLHRIQWALDPINFSPRWAAALDQSEKLAKVLGYDNVRREVEEVE